MEKQQQHGTGASTRRLGWWILPIALGVVVGVGFGIWLRPLFTIQFLLAIFAATLVVKVTVVAYRDVSKRSRTVEELPVQLEEEEKRPILTNMRPNVRIIPGGCGTGDRSSPPTCIRPPG